MTVHKVGLYPSATGEVALIVDVDRSKFKKRYDDRIAPTDTSAECKEWWTESLAAFSDGDCRSISPVTTIDFLWYRSLQDLQDHPENFALRRSVNAAALDGWLALRIDWVDDQDGIVMAQEPFWIRYP